MLPWRLPLDSSTENVVQHIFVSVATVNDIHKCKSKYKKVGVLPIRIVWSNEGPMLETLDHTIRIGSTPTFLYFDLYLHSAYAAHFV